MNLEFLEISLTLILLAVEVDYSQVSMYVCSAIWNCTQV